MARYIGPKLRLARRFGENILGSERYAKMKRKNPPGIHGTSKRPKKLSGYGKQLLEKQKVKYIYGLMERQFAKYVAEASEKTGDTSVILVERLESRLDNAVFRAGLGKTRNAARQMVTHGLITVNGKKVDIPSYQIRVGEVIAVADKKKNSPLFAGVLERIQKAELPSWISADGAKLSAKILNKPTLENPNFNAKAIIEFYSR